MDMADDEFGGSDCSEDEAKILSIFSVSKKLTGGGYLIFNAKKDNYAAKKGGKGTKNSEYLTSDAKKAFNLLQHIFTQVFIL